MGIQPFPALFTRRDPASPIAFPPQEKSIGGNACTSSYADASHNRSKSINYCHKLSSRRENKLSDSVKASLDEVKVVKRLVHRLELNTRVYT